MKHAKTAMANNRKTTVLKKKAEKQFEKTAVLKNSWNTNLMFNPEDNSQWKMKNNYNALTDPEK